MTQKQKKTTWTEFLGRAVIVALLISSMVEFFEFDIFGCVTFGFVSIILFIWVCKEFPVESIEKLEKKELPGYCNKCGKRIKY